jgi:uncharacterized membrane protein YqjE
MNTLRSLSAVGRAVAVLIEMRMRLFAAEFKLERMRLIRCIVLSILGATLLGTAFLVASTLIIFSIAEENRITALAVITVFLFSSASLCLGIALHYVYADKIPFKASAEALREDGECLISQLRK